MSPSAMARFVRIREVQSEPLDWLWPGRIALGKLTLLAGDPGLGKSLITIDMAARVTRGSAWPDLPDDRAPQGSVLLINTEDGLADTLRPRLEAADADLEQVTALDMTAHDGYTGSFALDRDLPALEQAINELGDCRLVVIDPISLALGRSNGNANVAVRALLAPLTALAALKHVAIVAVTHLNKSLSQRVLYRLMGSMAFMSAARGAWLVLADPRDTRRRLLLNLKNNLSREKTGLAYRLVESNGRAPRVDWERGEVTYTADEVLARVGNIAVQESLVVEWLRGQLDTIPVPAESILHTARTVGFSVNQIFRASQMLGVQKHKLGFSLGWHWSLPREKAGEA